MSIGEDEVQLCRVYRQMLDFTLLHRQDNTVIFSLYMYNVYI